MDSRNPIVEVYYGDPPTDRTEIEFLARLTADLERSGTNAVILANFTAGNARQIDAVVAIEKAACVVEIKGYLRSAKGDVNGPWTQTLPDGGERSLGERNPYVQAVGARHAVVDALVASTGQTKENLRRGLSGLVCIYPRIPDGSELPPGDFKAWVGDYARLKALLAGETGSPIPLPAWRGLAASLKLRPANEAEPSEPTNLIRLYQSRYADLQAAKAQPHVEGGVSIGEDAVSEAELVQKLLDGRQYQLVGESGCGKSELLERLGVEAAAQGLLPIAIAAHRFQASLEPLLKRAVATCCDASLPELLKAAGAMGAPLVLLVDALNECAADKRPDLIEALQAARLKFGARIILSSQEETRLPTMLAGDIVRMAQPDRTRARQIVESRLGRALHLAEEPGLEIVATANDAVVLADVIRVPAAADNRYSLYRAFARGRLGHSSESATAYGSLAELAAHMHGRFATSLPEAAASRLLKQHAHKTSHPDEIEELVLKSGLVVRQEGFIRFRHDLIADFFTAEQLLTQHTEPADLALELQRPINRQLVEFSIGGCATLTDVGRALGDRPALAAITASLRGGCGSPAREHVLSECETLLGQLTARFSSARFGLMEGTEGATHFPGIQGDFSSSPEIDERLRPYLAALPFSIREGLLPKILIAFRKVDAHLQAEGERLRGLHQATWRIRWPAEVIGTVYGAIWGCGDDAFHRIFQSARIPHGWPQARIDGVFPHVLSALSAPDQLTPGELFFLIEALIGFDDFKQAPPSNLTDLMAAAWSHHIYHLSLHAIDLGQRFGNRLDDDRRAAVGALLESWLNNNSPVLNGAIFDVLSMIGCWTPNTTVEDALRNFKEVLAQPASDEVSQEALTLYIHTFDHPDRDTISEAFYEGLTAEERKAFFARAAGARDRYSMAMAFVLADVARDPSPEAIPALLHYARLPERDTMSFQDSVSIFANAVGALAKLGVARPASDSQSDEIETVWAAIGALIYAQNSECGEDAAHLAWQELERRPGHAFDPIVLIEGTGRHWIKVDVTLSGSFTAEVLRLSRASLQPGYSPASIFGDRAAGMTDLPEAHRSFALSVLQEYGSASDLELVREWLEDKALGDIALRAARAIEARSRRPRTGSG